MIFGSATLPIARRKRAAAALAALLLGPFGPVAAAPDGPARPVAVAVDIAADATRTHVTVTLSGPVDASSFLLEGPDRAVIELPEVNFQVGGGLPRRTGLVSALRFGLHSPGRSRLVLELASPALVSRLEVVPGAVEGATLLQIDLARTERESFRRAVSGDRADLVLTTGSLGEAGTRDPRPAVAIDAGHGGADPGARAPGGLLEKDVTFAFAQALRERLAAGGRYRVVMTREEDVFVPLDDRVRRARDAGADLFLSIHADTIGNPHVSGATLYTGAENATDGDAAILAERENGADATSWAAGGRVTGIVSDILGELTLRETRSSSHRFSGLLLRDLRPVAPFSVNPQREAGFRVLRNPDLPSVLVELGYLSHPRDVERMTSAAWRDRVTAGMAQAVDRFFAGRLASRAAMSP